MCFQKFETKIVQFEVQAFLCNFNYLQIFVKAKVTEVKVWWFQCGEGYSAVVITTAQLHSTKPKLRFCAGSNPARGVLEIHDGEDLWQWSRLEIRLNAFGRSSIPQLCWSLFLNKNAGLQYWSFIKKRLQHSCFPMTLRNFSEHICERLFERFATWANNITSNGKWRRHFFKNKQHNKQQEVKKTFLIS